MKPKQKHKRGADRYSLDIYTPLTREECWKRLCDNSEDDLDGRFLVSRKGDNFTVRFRPNYISYYFEHFEGRFDPYIAGTHIYGRSRYTYSGRYIRPVLAYRRDITRTCAGLVLAPLVICIFSLILLSSWQSVFLALAAVFVLLSPIWLFVLYDLNRLLFLRMPIPWKSRSHRILAWIDEQLNVEGTNETETEA